MLPQAREEHLLVENLGDEVLVYDEDRNSAHRLNRTAALVWRQCDGQHTITELAALLHAELSIPADEELVLLTLDRLEKAHLLRQPFQRPATVPNVSRREVIRRLGLSGALILLLPIIDTITAPTPAMAQSRPDAGPPDAPEPPSEPPPPTTITVVIVIAVIIFIPVGVMLPVISEQVLNRAQPLLSSISSSSGHNRLQQIMDLLALLRQM
ncbi:MAG: hypothetical protein OJF51_000317 [Nitrospira sp.]|jgi:ABC-type antimicrobial peptide transport system permease subunit|nr:MAG: hypothetical protein OJF51_000317 [Nitrospira sp.]